MEPVRLIGKQSTSHKMQSVTLGSGREPVHLDQAMVPLRIDINDLPAGSGYELACIVAGERTSYPLPEGEICVGSSSRCEIQISAPGVRSRHFRVKRNGEKVFVHPIGQASLISAGQLIVGLEAIELGQSLTCGALTALFLRVHADDRVNAVPIPAAALQSDTLCQTPKAESEPLEAINAIFEQHLRSPDSVSPEQLLDTLSSIFAPVAAALFTRKPAQPWILLAQVSATSEIEISEPEKDDTPTWSLKLHGQEFRLQVQFSDGIGIAWKNAFCQQILLLTAACRLKRDSSFPAAETIQPLASNPGDGVWSEFVGSQMRSSLSAYTELCKCSDNVLLLGETGTGKELAAAALHRLWAGRGDFVALNCAAIPGDLLDAELFGIEAGTATGVSARRGRLEQAQGGTLFLDEISEMPMQLQSKLLRVLQERAYFKLGGKGLKQSDVKIIAASNYSAASLQAGKLRRDLYFRLTQATVVLPPLRQRRQDMAALCAHFLKQLDQQFHRNVAGLSQSALQDLKRYSWPGNVRELQNVLRSLYANAPSGGLIQSVGLPAEVREAQTVHSTGSLKSILREVQCQVVEREIEHAGSVEAAARTLGLSASYLHRLLKKLRPV